MYSRFLQIARTYHKLRNQQIRNAYNDVFFAEAFRSFFTETFWSLKTFRSFVSHLH